MTAILPKVMMSWELVCTPSLLLPTAYICIHSPTVETKLLFEFRQHIWPRNKTDGNCFYQIQLIIILSAAAVKYL